MPRWDENTGTGWGSTDLKISDIFSLIIADGSTLIARCTPHPRWRSKFFAVYINGVWKGNFKCPWTGPWEMVFSLDVGTIASSFYVVEAGAWDDYETERAQPSGWITNHENDFAKRLRISWSAEYITEGPTGDSQLASIVVTGGDRGVNCESVTDFMTRAVISYSITTSGSTHYVRVWANGVLQAEGSRIGDGLVTCSAIGSSNLTVSGILTYTSDILAGIAKISLRWPLSYEVNYDTSVLAFPRDPEFVLYDDGVSNDFQYLTPVLSGPKYYYNVLARSDENVLQTSITPPSDSPKSVNQRPVGPTITSVTGTAANTVVHWSEGEGGCSYNVYYSSADQPVNIGEWELPVPFSVGTGVVQATLPLITGWAPVNREPWVNTLQSSMAAAVLNINNVWQTGETGFDAALTVFETAIIAALEVYEESMDYNMDDPKEEIWDNVELCRQSCQTISGNGLTTIQWQNATREPYARLLSCIGVYYDHQPLLWLPSDGIAGLVPYPNIQTSLVDLARPFVYHPTFCCIVRATRQSDSLQEAMDAQYCWSYDADGNVEYPTPNDAYLEDTTINGTDITLEGIYYDSDEQGIGDYLDFYVVPATGNINYDSPTSSAVLSESVAGKKIATSTISTTSGYKKISVKARVSATGRRSLNSVEKTIYVSGLAPDGVVGLRCEVIRGETATG